MDVYWFEQNLDDVPERDDWLSPLERLHLAALRFPKRRTEWRLGRWAAKCAVALYLQLPINSDAVAGIEIATASSGAPFVLVSGVQPAPTISISHRSGMAACGLSNAQVRLGCDLELIEPRGEAFVSDYFTHDEQDFVARALPADRPRLISLVWSAKESALKALKEGLRLDTRSVRVCVEPQSKGDWARLQVCSAAGDTFQGWWRQNDKMVQTIVADLPFARPVSLWLPVTDLADVLKMS